MSRELIVTARTASTRTRTLATAYLVFLILTSVTFVNVYLLNWNDMQLNEAVLASKLLRKADPTYLPVLGWKAGPEGNPARALARAWVDALPIDEQRKLGKRPDLVRVAEFAIRMGWDSSSVASVIEYRERYSRDNLLSVPVPLTQLRIDINSFGLFFTTGLTMVLLGLYACLRHERTCLRELKKRVDPFTYGDVELDSAVRATSSPIGRGATVIALTVPMLFAICQLRVDWASREFGNLISSHSTTAILIGECVGLCLAALIGVLAAMEAMKAVK